MRFMILVRASPASESGAMPTEKQIAEQLAFHLSGRSASS